tara:strand:+ start:484 stop:711 length:228 start_codon:yes stop_codon:yes gene_type:complete
MTEQEQTAKIYNNAGDSVSLINQLVGVTDRSDEDNDCLDRNVRHLKIILKYDCWTTEDLSPFKTAIAAGEAALSS